MIWTNQGNTKTISFLGLLRSHVFCGVLSRLKKQSSVIGKTAEVNWLSQVPCESPDLHTVLNVVNFVHTEDSAMPEMSDPRPPFPVFVLKYHIRML